MRIGNPGALQVLAKIQTGATFDFFNSIGAKRPFRCWTLDLASSLWLDLVQTGRTGGRLALSCLPPPDGAPYPSMPRWWHDPRLWSSTAPIYAKTPDHARSFRFREEPCPNVGSFGMTGRGTDRAVGRGDLLKTPLDKPLPWEAFLKGTLRLEMHLMV